MSARALTRDNLQQVIFLSDGGDTVRDLQLYLNPCTEHVLDWFHITIRLTVLRQFVKGIRAQAEAKDTKKGRKRMQEEESIIPGPDELERELERIKWYLWHGSATDALRLIDEMEHDLEWVEEPSAFIQKLLQAKVYITTNQSFLLNYGDRYRNGETISTAFVESTVNEVISKGFVKRQHPRWTRRGAHHLLQVRLQALNQTLRETFCCWYPHLSEAPSPLEREVSS